jgi:hypothetical protein
MSCNSAYDGASEIDLLGRRYIKILIKFMKKSEIRIKISQDNRRNMDESNNNIKPKYFLKKIGQLYERNIK